MFQLDQIFINLRQAFSSQILFLLLFILIILISKKNFRTISMKILTLLILFFICIYIYTILFYFQLRPAFRYLFFMYVPSFVFIAPTSYLYISSLLVENFKIDKKQFRHLYLPIVFFIFNLLLNIIAQINPFLVGRDTLTQIHLIQKDSQLFGIYYIIPAQLIFYGLISVRKYIMYRKNLINFFSNTKEVRMPWVSSFIVSFLIYLFVLVVANNKYIMMLNVNINKEVVSIIEHINAVFFIFVIGIYASRSENYFDKAIKKSVDLVKNSQFARKTEQALQVDTETNQDSDLKKAQNAPITDELMSEIVEKIEYLMNVEKIYLENSLTLVEFAAKLNTNRTYLSKIINEHYQMSFFTFINNFRVEEAKKNLDDPKYDKYSLNGIANLSGFSSNGTFLRIFKQFNGLTPSEYKKRRQQLTDK
jgi:AraC-like DNA-binding protein